MKQPSREYQSKNIFRNVYFWLAVGGSIFLLYVAFIAFTFLPRSTSEVTNVEANKTSNASPEKTRVISEKQKKNIASKGTGTLSKVRFDLIERGGWVDSDDRKMTIVLRVFNLSPAIVDEIIRSGGIEIEIDGVTATIINSEPYQKNGFLTRAEAALSVEKFDKFSDGDTQSIEIKTILHYDADSAADVINKRFGKQDKTEVEGVKIAWK